jgi:uncharacterized protein
VDPEQPGTRLMIFLTEDDRVGPRSTHDALLQRAREDGMAGATVWRAIEGFGRSGRVRAARFPDVARGLPLVVELIDDEERIESFLPVVAELAPNALVTTEPVGMLRPRGAGRLALDDPLPGDGGA